MNKAIHTGLHFLLIFHFKNSYSQTLPAEIKWINNENQEHDANYPCITKAQYELIESNCNNNVQLLKLEVLKTEQGISLAWPLKTAPGLNDCSYYRISAYVDQNTATGSFFDFNCGMNTYDGHRGTDISIWPNNFYKMDSNFVEVIAAAPGTIVEKHDGEFDKNCSGNTLTANYIVVQHDDGSRALYWHMKKNSLTSKSIGQVVTTGDYLGSVGSSGSSSGPHLHFEVWSGATIATRIDPFAGTCNSLNATSWWTSQKPYVETAIVKASTNTTDIVIPPCPGTEILNESSVFQIPFQGIGLPAGFAKFYIFIRDEKSGLTGDMSILNPDGSIFTSWTYSSSSDTKTRIQGWSKKLPVTSGKYTFKTNYNGTGCSSTFEIMNSTTENEDYDCSDIKLYPNPTNGMIIIEAENEINGSIEIYNVFKQLMYQSKISGRKTEKELHISSGIYFYKIKVGKHLVKIAKLQVY